MEVRVELTYQTVKGTEATFHSEGMPAGKALLLAEDLEKTGRVKHLAFTDRHESGWTLKELRKYVQGIQTEPHHVSVYFDGGFDVKERKSGLGCVIYYEQNGKKYRLRRNALVGELDTNNEAEYAACHLAVRDLEALGVRHLPVIFSGDSKVVINQLNGEWPCYDVELNKWADRIEGLMSKLGITPEYNEISRKENREADRLAGQALDGVEISGTKQLDAGGQTE